MSIPTCAEYGTHRMRSQSFAHIKDKKTDKLIYQFTYYYCNCGDYFACDGLPHKGNRIGNYLTNDYLQNSGGIDGIMVFRVDPSDIEYTSKSTLPGYNFIS